MNFAILVNAAPYSQQSSLTAYHFCSAVLAQGHRLPRIFFYQDGVLNGNSFISPPQDEFNLVQAWQQLAEQYGVELSICISAALRRGLLDTTEAERYQHSGANLATKFTLTGLGQLVEAMIHADRFLVFN